LRAHFYFFVVVTRVIRMFLRAIVRTGRRAKNLKNLPVVPR